MQKELLILLSFLSPLIGACLCLGLRNIRLCGLVASLSSWSCFVLLSFFLLPFLGQSEGTLSLFPGLICDKLSAAFLLLTAFVVSISLSQAGVFFQTEILSSQPPKKTHIQGFFAFSLLFLLSMMAVFVCDNLGALWISVEATSLLSAGLVYFSRSKHAIEATWKYLIICSVGIAFALLGTIFIFSSSQYGAIEGGSLNMSALSMVSDKLQPLFLKLGFIFCLVGYGTKAGIFPLHSWLPDAHSEAPAPASAMLSAGLLNCALFAIGKILLVTTGSACSHFCHQTSIWAGVITVLAASLFLVKQHGLKRLWAYSSIENVGLMLVAIGFGSGTLFYLQALNHSLVKVALFCLSGNIIQLTGTKELSHISGIMRKTPLDAVLLVLASLAITGTPPFGTFISEWMLLSFAIDQKAWLVAVIIILALTIAFIAISIHVGRILVGSPKESWIEKRGVKYSIVPSILMTASIILGFIISPELLRWFP